MSLVPFDSILGRGAAHFRQGLLIHFYLDAAKATPTRRFRLGIQGLSARDGADDTGRAQDLIEAACVEFLPFVNALEALEQQAVNRLLDLGWPQDVPLEGQQLVFFASFGAADQPVTEAPARLSLLCAGTHLVFDLPDPGSSRFLGDTGYLETVIAQARQDARLAALPQLSHRVFGPIQRDTLVSLKRRRVEGKMVAFDLYLSDDHVAPFEASMLDPFVPLRRDLPDLLPRVTEALLPLRQDWAADWLDPANATARAAFDRVFPQAKADGISADAFRTKLRLSRICICPADGAATWDFHLLPRQSDDTIFVARTTADGQVIEVTTES